MLLDHFGTSSALFLHLKSELISPPSLLQQLYKANYLPIEYPEWSKCVYRHYLVLGEGQNDCEWIIGAYFHEKSFTYPSKFRENPYFAPKSIKFGHFLVCWTSLRVYTYHFQTEFSKKTPEIAVTAIDKKLLKFWSANFEQQKSQSNANFSL